MALAHAILASLLDGPQTGYDLAKRFAEEGYFWRASHQQIYRELSRLEAEGAIDLTTDEPGARGDRPRAITTAGRNRLTEWGAQPSEPATIKEDVLVKCLAVELIDPDALIAQISEHRERHKARAHQHADHLLAQFPDGPPRYDPHLGRYLALQGGLIYERAWIDWANLALKTLKQGGPRR